MLIVLIKSAETVFIFVVKGNPRRRRFLSRGHFVSNCQFGISCTGCAKLRFNTTDDCTYPFSGGTLITDGNNRADSVRLLQQVKMLYVFHEAKFEIAPESLRVFYVTAVDPTFQ